LPAVQEAAYNDPDPEVRDPARIILGVMQRTEGDLVTRLIDSLSDGRAGVRVFAANALGLLRAPRAVPPLRHVAETDEESLVRNAATLSLLRITNNLDV